MKIIEIILLHIKVNFFVYLDDENQEINIYSFENNNNNNNIEEEEEIIQYPSMKNIFNNIVNPFKKSNEYDYYDLKTGEFLYENKSKDCCEVSPEDEWLNKKIKRKMIYETENDDYKNENQIANEWNNYLYNNKNNDIQKNINIENDEINYRNEIEEFKPNITVYESIENEKNDFNLENITNNWSSRTELFHNNILLLKSNNVFTRSSALQYLIDYLDLSESKDINIKNELIEHVKLLQGTKYCEEADEFYKKY